MGLKIARLSWWRRLPHARGSEPSTWLPTVACRGPKGCPRFPGDTPSRFRGYYLMRTDHLGKALFAGRRTDDRRKGGSCLSRLLWQVPRGAVRSVVKIWSSGRKHGHDIPGDLAALLNQA